MKECEAAVLIVATLPTVYKILALYVNRNQTRQVTIGRGGIVIKGHSVSEERDLIDEHLEFGRPSQGARKN